MFVVVDLEPNYKQFYDKPSDFRPEWPNNIISGLTYSQVHVYTVLLLCFISIALRYTIFHKTLFTNYLYDSIYYMLFSYQTGYIMSHYIPCLIANNRYITDLTIVFFNHIKYIFVFYFFVFLDVLFHTSDILSTMTSEYVSHHISCMRCLMKENPVLNF